MEQRSLVISVIGLGKLGCTMMACFAHKGWKVIGVDVNKKFVDLINKKKSPINEPQVEELIIENQERIHATSDFDFAIRNSDVSFVIVPTPSKEDGSFSTKYVEEAVLEIARVLKKKDSYHLVVITSTVLPGDTLRIAYDIAKESGKEIGKDFGICYNPDFIALGKVVYDFLNPDMLLIGEYDKRSGDITEKIHRDLIYNDPSIHRMSIYNAELAKISLNAYITLKITFANIIAEICEKMPGGDSGKVLKAIGSDSRVGKKYFRGGLGYSGPCFPRDNRALAYSAKFFGTTHYFCEMTDAINNYHRTERICSLLLKFLEERRAKELSILGLSYKENTPVIEESVPISVIRILYEKNISIKVFDPVAMDSVKQELEGYKIEYASSEYESLKDTSVCFIATPWKQFKELDFSKIVKLMKDNSVVLDAWDILSFSSFKEGDKRVEVRQLGRNYS